MWAPILLVALQRPAGPRRRRRVRRRVARCSPSTRRRSGAASSARSPRPACRSASCSARSRFLLVALLPDDQLNAWGWRVPFLARLRADRASRCGCACGSRSRRCSRRSSARQTVVKLPLVEAVKRYPRSVLVGIGAHVCDTAAAYMFATFTVAYAVDELGMTKGVVLGAVVTYGILVIITQPLSARSVGPDRPPAAEPVRRDLHRPVGVPVLRARADRRAGARVGRADRRRGRRLGADDRRPARVLRRAVRRPRALHGLRHLARAGRGGGRLLAADLASRCSTRAAATRGWSRRSSPAWR